MTFVVIFLFNYDLLGVSPIFYTLFCPKTLMCVGCTKGEQSRSLVLRLRVQVKDNFYIAHRDLFCFAVLSGNQAKLLGFF
jgi:hypothetical protein